MGFVDKFILNRLLVNCFFLLFFFFLGESGFFRIRRGNDECAIESLAVGANPVV
jgi:hypothetical protein